ncbi:unnamed protein product [Thelazia callipaeda]|uniref:Uncharacterized protein n=1 Tax=Thelazia callipaeda TaxID=103827 RepID=A0A0N5CNQ0_THECL|nr:unnamed protein product [Thelazia callipaeda]
MGDDYPDSTNHLHNDRSQVPSISASDSSFSKISQSSRKVSPSESQKKRFLFSTSNIRFWTTGKSEKKKQKLTNDVLNHGDQLRHVKEQRYSMRRLANFDFINLLLNTERI